MPNNRNNLFNNKYRIGSNRLQGRDYDYPGWYFITICTYKHLNLFGSIINNAIILNSYGRIAFDEWMRSGVIRKNIDFDEFVVMPNHIHALIGLDFKHYNSNGTVVENKTRLSRKPNSISTIVGGFKASVTKKINTMKNCSTFKVWQPNYYDHIVRNEKSLNKIRTYIINNPCLWNKDKYFKID